MSAFLGVRILDFSRHFPAAMAGMHLADFGAEVIKIDPDARERGREEPGFLAWNRNKKRLVLDIASPAGLAGARALIADADVVIFDDNPGALEPKGLDAQALNAAHPALVHAWAPPYGVRGAWSDLPPAHNVLTALTGAAFRQSSYSDQPVHLTTPQAYYGQANCLAAAIGAALVERARSGAGQSLVVSGLHGAAQVSASAHVDNAPPVLLWGKPLGGTPAYRLYQCADGEWFFLGTLFQAFFVRALEASGVLEDLLAAPEIGGELANALRPPGSALTTARLEAAFRTRTRAEWLDALQRADVPCGPVRRREDWFASETIAANAMRVTHHHRELGPVVMPGVSARLSATPGAVRGLAQTVGPDEVRPRPAAPGGSPAARAPGTAAPLAGVRVLDMGTVIAGAYAGAILASLGADVVKIEPREGDPFRSSSAMFASYNRGKRGLGLDLKHPEARALFFDLARQADVVLDNYRLGVRERLGIGYEALRAVNPRIISLSITGYGAEGPQAALPGFDPLMQAQSGMMQAQGGAAGEPVFYQIAVNDVGSAAMSAFAVIAALHARERTGAGQQATTSLASQSVLLQIGELTTYPGAPSPADGGRDCLGARALERYYECADGWIALACATPDHYAGLAAALGLSQRDGHTGLAQPRDGDLAAEIAATLRPLARAAALERLRAAGAPAAPALRGPETFEDAYLAENGYFDVYEHGVLGPIKGVSGFALWGRSVAGFSRAAPELGEHSAEVLADYGVPAARVAALIGMGAVIVGPGETPSAS